MEALLIWERIVLESLARSPKNQQGLEDDTSIKKNILHKITAGLIQKKTIVQKDGRYFLGSKPNSQVAEEIKDLFSTLVNTYYAGNNRSVLKLKKCYFTSEELKIFQAYLYSIEALIENVQKERCIRPVKSKIYEQKVILWAYTQYSNLLEGI
ncbi:MAG: hypothetical protein DRQ89_11915 [Epsilonproteobacteria bacterium]|nr:MAG: hypothetical protein DRQ89_11915 [Campylobacterota bacterium]